MTKAKTDNRLKELWLKAQDTLRDLGKTNPQMALGGLLATTTFLLIQRELQGEFQVGAGHEDNPMNVSKAIVARLWLSPWLPFMFMNAILRGTGSALQGIADWFGGLFGKDPSEPVPDLMVLIIEPWLRSDFVKTAHFENPDGSGWVRWHVRGETRLFLGLYLSLLPFFTLPVIAEMVKAAGEIVPG